MTTPNTGYQASYAAKEARFMDLRRSGATANEAARTLGLTPTAQDNFERYYRAQTFSGATDSSCPRFAYHNAHVAKVMEANRSGFPIRRLTEAGSVTVGVDGRLWRAA